MERNPLLRESDVQFLLREVFEVGRLCELERFSHLDLETFELYISAARTLWTGEEGAGVTECRS